MDNRSVYNSFEKWKLEQKEIPNFPSKLIFKTIQDQNAAVVGLKNKETDYMFVIQPIDFVENKESWTVQSEKITGNRTNLYFHSMEQQKSFIRR